MSIRIKHCIVIICDLCDETAGSDEGDIHFDDVDEATTHFHDDDPESGSWIMTNAEHVCPACRGKRECATSGHQWSSWYDQDARGIPMSHRFCHRYGCNANEIAMAPVGGA